MTQNSSPHSEAVPSLDEPGRYHSVFFATLLALLIPGAGQAYNGQPIKGAFLLATSALVLPWLLSLFDARRVARRLVEGGGRYRKGGLVWVVFHLWFTLNFAGLVLLGLTFAGVIS